jgi:hypothetical protein
MGMSLTRTFKEKGKGVWEEEQSKVQSPKSNGKAVRGAGCEKTVRRGDAAWE